MDLPSTTLLVVRGNADIELAEQEKRDAEARANEPLRSSLLDYVKDCYVRARDARDNSGQTERLLSALRRRNNEYDAVTLALITAYNLPKIRMHIAETKCNAAEAWAQDIENTTTGRTWCMEATPEPDLPAEDEARIRSTTEAAMLNALQQGETISPEELRDLEERLRTQMLAQRNKEAAAAAKRQENRIRDDLAEGNWQEAKKEFKSYCMTTGIGFLKGPMPRIKTRLKWVGDTCEPVDTIVYETDTPHPMDMFPSPDSSKFANGYIIERKRSISAATLAAWKELPGYDRDAISRLIASGPNGTTGKEIGDQERARLESKTTDFIEKSNGYECFEFWGPVEGKYLAERGIKGVDPDKVYPYRVEWCGSEIILTQLNPDPLGGSIYHEAIYMRQPGSPWGKGIPHLVEHADDIGCSAGRALVFNMAISAAPQVDVDMNQVDPETNLTTMIQGKIWKTQSKPGVSRAAVIFFSPRDNTANILANYDRAEKMADDASNIPAYTYGADAPSGAGGTASGYAMLQNAAARGMKDCLWNMDLAVISYIQRHDMMLRLYNPDPTIRGDCRVVAKGTMGVLLQELHQAQVREFVDRIMTPLGVEIFGPETIVKVMHEYGDLLKIDHNEILPSAAEVLERVRQQAEMQGQQQAAEQARQMAAIEAQEKRADAKTKIEMAKAAEEIRGKQAERASRFLSPPAKAA